MNQTSMFLKNFSGMLADEQTTVVRSKTNSDFSFSGFIPRIMGSQLSLEDKLTKLLANRFLPNSVKGVWAKKLIDLGVDVTLRNHVLLRWASEHGDLDLVKSALTHGANIHCLKEEPLIRATLNGHQDVVQFLIEQGANLHGRDDASLRLAASMGYQNLVKELITLGANVTARQNEAIRKAFDGGYSSTLRILLSLKATEILEFAFAHKDKQIFAISWDFALKQNDETLIGQLKRYCYRPQSEPPISMCSNKFDAAVFSSSLQVTTP